jgi:hypothetical protein
MLIKRVNECVGKRGWGFKEEETIGKMQRPLKKNPSSYPTSCCFYQIFTPVQYLRQNG